MSVPSPAPDPRRRRSVRFTGWGSCDLQFQRLAQESHPHLRASLSGTPGTVQARDAVQTDHRVSGRMSGVGFEMRLGCLHPLGRSSRRKLSPHELHQVICCSHTMFARQSKRC